MRHILLICLLALPAAASAYDLGEMAEFNDSYKNGRYEDALEGYKKVIAKEPANPWGYYNAGNALFRLGRLGPAVFNYAKAFTLDPRSTDIRANLDFALRQTGQTLVQENVPKTLHYFYYCLSDTELKAAIILLFWLACLIGGAGLLLAGSGPGVLARKVSFSAAGLLLLVLAWMGARQSSTFTDAGVVTKSGGTRMLSGPGENFKTYASAPEGHLVKILDADDENYYEIGLTKEGIKGWALKSEVDRL